MCPFKAPASTLRRVHASPSVRRFLQPDFTCCFSTVDSLRTGNIMSVLNIVMQLRKCCNHPNLFEPRPVVSPCITKGISWSVPRTVQCADAMGANCTVLSLMSNVIPRSASHSLVHLGDPTTLLAEVKREAEPHLPKVDGFKFTADPQFKNFSSYVAPVSKVGTHV